MGRMHLVLESASGAGGKWYPRRCVRVCVYERNFFQRAAEHGGPEGGEMFVAMGRCRRRKWILLCRCRRGRSADVRGRTWRVGDSGLIVTLCGVLTAERKSLNDEDWMKQFVYYSS